MHLRPLCDSPSIALGRERTQRIVQALGCALGDYTVDERGDVGSWVRIASVHGIGWISRALFEELQPTLLEQYFPSNSYFVAFAALLKQGSERLDTVRQEAGMQITNLLALHSTLLTNGALARWHPPGFELLSAAFLGSVLSWSRYGGSDRVCTASKGSRNSGRMVMLCIQKWSRCSTWRSIDDPY